MTDQKQWFPSHNIADWKSAEEYYFYWWCVEAEQYGIIFDFKYNEEENLTIDLLSKVEIDCMNKSGKKIIPRHLLNDLKYTYDFHVSSDNSNIFLDIMQCPNESKWKLLKSQHGICCIDTKGSFDIHHDSLVKFPLLQKIVWDKTGIYVNKLIPEKFFLTTFAPKCFFYSPTGELRYKKDKKGNGKKTYYNDIYLNVEQYLKTI